MKNTLNTIKILTLALVLTVGLQYAYAAWVGPVSSPPNGNTSAPINIGSTSQTKSGAIWSSFFGTTGGGYFGGSVGVGTTNPTAKLEVAGNIVASDPTASNQVATKGYVDAASGGGGSSYMAVGTTACATGWTNAYTGWAFAVSGSSYGGVDGLFCSASQTGWSNVPGYDVAVCSLNGGICSYYSTSGMRCALCVK